MPTTTTTSTDSQSSTTIVSTLQLIVVLHDVAVHPLKGYYGSGDLQQLLQYYNTNMSYSNSSCTTATAQPLAVRLQKSMSAIFFTIIQLHMLSSFSCMTEQLEVEFLNNLCWPYSLRTDQHYAHHCHDMQLNGW